MCSDLAILGALALALASPALPPARVSANEALAGGRVFLTVDEALALAFAGCTVERTSVYLTDEQREEIGELAGHDFERRILRPYVARKDGELVGTAYFDTHRVRTLDESLMVVVAPDDTIKRIELLAFGEPREYIPRAKWYAQFLGKKLDADLSLKRGIRGITGATLTARATLNAVRGVLAAHEVVSREG